MLVKKRKIVTKPPLILHFYVLNFNKGMMAENERENLTSKDEKHSFEFDDIFDHVASFGRYQILWLVFIGFVLIFPVTTQFTLLVFANGTPNFHCVTPNITCETKKCCDECTLYEFDGPFQSTVSEVCI